MSAPEVSVVIVSYGTRDLTLSALESIRERARAGSLEAVVVDNDSPDDSADAVAAAHPWATLLRSPKNLGFAGGANLGAGSARGEWLLFLNSDARLTEDSLPRLLAAGRDLPAPGAIAPRIVGPRGPELSVGHFYGPWRDVAGILRLNRVFPGVRALDGVRLSRLPRRREAVDWVSGACMLIRRDVFGMLKGFDEAYFMYVEDMDLCYRLKREGRTNLFVPDAIVHHVLGASPRASGILIEGGTSPEYFVRKFGLRYPWLLQRGLRVLGLAVWLATTSLQQLGRGLRGRPSEELAARARLCRRSLGALLRRRAGSVHDGPSRHDANAGEAQ